uniref:Uncharacterized protein n=1 Tax=Anguilla anguilla TaxID=7936 RepID=A0A0E9VV80_ANGAN
MERWSQVPVQYLWKVFRPLYFSTFCYVTALF